MKKKEENQNRGLILINTGNGKGKTTAALGTAFRACGYGKKVIMIQFIKGTIKSGEETAIKKLHPLFELIPAGRGFYKIRGDSATEDEHRAAARNAMCLAREAIHSNKYFLVILDEISVALKLKLIALKDVLELIDSKPPKLHLFITGRNAHKSVKARADMITEFHSIRHPFDKGLYARKGIDF